MKMMKVLAMGALCAASEPVAWAEATAQCVPEVIVDLSERILRHRTEVGRFQVRRTGATAAYLLGHYGGLSQDDQMALLSQLREGGRNVALQDAHEMALALAVTRDGVEAGLRYFGGDPVEAAAAAHFHLRRAVILADAGESFFRLINEALTNPERAQELGMVLNNVGVVVIDQDDAFLGQFSENAEAAGHVVAATTIAANMQNKDRLTELLARYADDPDVGWMMDLNGLDAFGGVWRTQVSSLRPDPAPEQRDLFDIVRADTLSGPIGFLGIGTNITGLTEPMAVVAREYLAAVEAGHIDAFATPEAAWLMQYRGLIRVAGGESAFQMVNGYDWPSTSIRHFAAQAYVTLDRIQTYVALGPVMQGAAFPQRPVYLTAAAPWEELEPFVTALAADPMTVPATPEEAVLGFELLWRAGQFDHAIALAEAQFEISDRVKVYSDVIRRMDGLCDSVLAFPGQSLLFGGQVVYRYPPATFRD